MNKSLPKEMWKTQKENQEHDVKHVDECELNKSNEIDIAFSPPQKEKEPCNEHSTGQLSSRKDILKSD